MYIYIEKVYDGSEIFESHELIWSVKSWTGEKNSHFCHLILVHYLFSSFFSQPPMITMIDGTYQESMRLKYSWSLLKHYIYIWKLSLRTSCVRKAFTKWHFIQSWVPINNLTFSSSVTYILRYILET